ncbi:hypothetical protein ABK040_008854 [Willaertia magna]
MRREGKRCNVRTNQTVKSCPLCTKWHCHFENKEERNLYEKYNSNKSFRKEFHKCPNDILIEHKIIKESDLEHINAETMEVPAAKRIQCKRFSSGYVSRNVGYSRRSHRTKDEGYGRENDIFSKKYKYRDFLVKENFCTDYY